MKLRKAWQAMSDDSGGISQVPGALFWSHAEAAKRCDGWGKPPAPREHDVLVDDDGRVFLLSSAVTVYESGIELERAMALVKLTERERRVLGLIPGK